MKKKTCSTTRLSQKVYERDFCSHVLANLVRYVYTYIYDRQVLLDFSSESLLLIATALFFMSGKKKQTCVTYFRLIILYVRGLDPYVFLNGSVSFSLLLCVKDVLWFLCL